MGLLQRLFKLSDNNSSAKQELTAGLTTFAAMADGVGSTTIATGATVGASVVRLPNGNWGVAMLGTGFPPGSAVRLLVRDLTGPAINIFYVTYAASTSPTTVCPGTTPCTVRADETIRQPASSLSNVTVALTLSEVGGVPLRPRLPEKAIA